MSHDLDRRSALACLGLAAGTLFSLDAGVLQAAPLDRPGKAAGKLLFVQISDTHIGFAREANPDVGATLERTIDRVNALPERPALILHTGDITQLSKPSEFEEARQRLSRLRVSELHAIPGEHDMIDGTGEGFLSYFGAESKGRGYYSFDHEGVHFVGLVNVQHFKANGLGAFGEDQIAWLKDDLSGRSASQPLVLFAHMPMWTIYEPWGWGTSDAEQVFELTRRFGSVTVLNGHIHQIVQKTEGNLTFHTARSTAFPQPAAGVGSDGPGPLKVAADELPRRLGLSTVAIAPMPGAAAIADATLA